MGQSTGLSRYRYGIGHGIPYLILHTGTEHGIELVMEPGTEHGIEQAQYLRSTDRSLKSSAYVEHGIEISRYT